MEFFKKHGHSIQGISNIIQALTVVALVFVTGWYGWHTKTMSDTMKREFDITNRPHISVGDISKYIENGRLILRAPVINYGKIPALIASTTKSYSLINIGEEDIIKIDIDPESKVLTLNPSEAKINGFFTIPEELFQYNINIYFKLIYYSTADEKKENKYCIEYHYRYNGDPENKINIVNADASCK